MANNIPILGQGQRQSVTFRRIDGFVLEVGAVVRYMLPRPFLFEVAISREGIAIQGEYPICGKDGILALNLILRRAMWILDAMQATPVGAKQNVPTEQDLAAAEANMRATVEAKMAGASSKVGD